MENVDFEEVLKILGRTICYLRRQKGWSQERLAFESGLGRATMGAIERGEANLRLTSLMKLGQALDVTVAQLFESLDSPQGGLRKRKFSK